MYAQFFFSFCLEMHIQFCELHFTIVLSSFVKIAHISDNKSTEIEMVLQFDKPSGPFL